MSWFAGLLISFLNLIPTGLQQIPVGSNANGVVKLGIYNIITGMLMYNPKAPIGSGTWGDILDIQNLKDMTIFQDAFKAFAGAFFLVSIYLLSMHIAQAASSSIQREKLKSGIVALVIAAALIGVGEYFAVFITQMSYGMSLFFLKLGGADKLTTALLPLHQNHPAQELLTVIVNIVQVLMSILIYITYLFREMFLIVWIAVFPLFQAFYANEKTRPLAKMWWVEWIYQMAIPLGQALVFGVACLVAAPSNKLEISDIFASLAGTIGLFLTAVYMRRIVDAVAQQFGAAGLGHSSGEGLMHGLAMGAGFTAGDKLGSLGIKGASKVAGKPAGALFRKVDNTLGRRLAAGAVTKHSEVHAGAIREGASLDDILMHHQGGRFNDALGTGAVGLEAAAKGSHGSVNDLVSATRGIRGSGGGGSTTIDRLLGSRTFGAGGQALSGAKNTVAQSNLATAWRTHRQGTRNQGGNRLGHSMSHPQAAMRANRLKDAREQMRKTMALNASAQRVPNIASQYNPGNSKQGIAPHFQGKTMAENAYSNASFAFVKSLQTDMGMSRQQAISTWKDARTQWNNGKQLDRQIRQTMPASVQQAYNTAASYYQPAKMDREAKKAVLNNDIAMRQLPNTHVRNKMATNAFLQDARRALQYKR